MTLSIDNLMTLAALGLLIVLRFDARRFGAADFDDERDVNDWRGWASRLTWYGLGILLIVVIYFVFAQPETLLHLRLGEPKPVAFLWGLALAFVGAMAGLVYAWWRFGVINLPDGRAYPVGLLNSLATAFIDEAAFRGVLLGLLLWSNWPPIYAVTFQAVVYALATRLGGAGRPRSLLALWLGMGLLSGMLTVITGGIGAALLAHTLTRFAIFVATGHAGQVTPTAAAEDETQEEIEATEDADGLAVVPERAPSSQARPIE
ncbi:MAG: CPBP family intramembrane metalloprotease [Chloroflexota bacterium]|nr:CPBP family intramembrane metalloprotease [Chloroflexota bacterium]